MARWFRRWRPRRKIVRRRRVTKKAPRSTKALKKLIQQVVSKNVEDKQAFHDSSDTMFFFNSGINSNADFYQIVPNISRGTAENERVGEKIRAKSLVIRGHMYLDADVVQNNLDNKRVGVRMMIVQSKRQPTYNGTRSLSGANLLEKGGSSTSFSGVISHLYTPINTEEYKVFYDKTFYLSQSYTAFQAGTSTPSVIWSTDVSKGLRFFTIKIPLRGKILQYSQDNESDLLPINFGPALCLGYSHLNGGAVDTVTTKVAMTYDVTFNYEDA